MAIIDQNDQKVQKEEKGQAFILAIGTANPSNYMLQADYPDYYFRITNSEDMSDLKKKFKRICDNTTIQKRHMYLTEEILKKNSNMCDFMAPSLDARLDIVGVEVPKLSKEAAEKAIQEWGQHKSQITHLVFCTAMGAGLPGADYELIKLLGLNHSVMRVTMYLQGCNAGGTALRVAKDIAENNKGARVLVVCCEMNVLQFRGPSITHFESLICQSLFGDGAAALIVGADPDTTKPEHPLFQLLSASQTLIPETNNGVGGSLREVGLTFYLSKKLPDIISKNLTSCLVNAFTPLGINDWNSIFWITHPGGPAILDQVEANLGLDEGKLRASRHVLREYGNLSSASVLFIMDEMRKKSLADGKTTSGEGHDYGVLFGFGPGLSVDTIVLRSIPFSKDIESTGTLLF